MSGPAERDGQETALAAASYLRALKHYGVDAFYGVAGTDFPSIVEAFSASGGTAADMPEPVTVPHENLAASMAHGHAMVTGRAQAVMVHVSVGTANTVCGALNASRDYVPMLLSAGRTPVTEKGRHGTRSRHPHWAQEMFDQAAMLREAVKWDYELRFPEQSVDAVRRAMEVAHAAPAGPVYLSLPREVLGMQAPDPGELPPMGTLSRPGADPAAIAQIAAMIRSARHPVIVTSHFGADPAAVPVLAELAERWALPVVGNSARRAFLPGDHPMHLGFSPDGQYAEADLIIALDCEVPWMPAMIIPKAAANLVQIGMDPLAEGYPMRSYPAVLSLTADSKLALTALGAELGVPDNAAQALVTARRERLAAQRKRDRARWAADGAVAELTPASASAALHRALPKDAIITNEYPLRPEQCPPASPGSYFGLSPVGGLGWGLGAALGVKKAMPDRTVVSVLGDGAYMFNNPTACHFVAEANELPVLAVIFNNGCWGAVRNSTLAMHGQGAAAAGGGRLLADLRPQPDYEKVIEAHRGLGLRATSVSELDAALEQGLKAVANGQQTLINVLCDY
ncbi:MAG: thiamine pyrophosphate-requiring protein [Pararhodobacter sp.]|nr:thiamine pyrophosphate-requiring protein [Pararhodobacter sp.]